MIKRYNCFQKTKSFTKTCLILLATGIGLGSQVIAQKGNLQNWNSIGAKIGLSKKTSLYVGELASFTPSAGYNLNFAQTQLELSHDISKRFSLAGGDMLNYIPSSSRSLRNRVFIKASINERFSRLFKAEHALQVEFHDKNENHYSKRFILINKLSLRKRFSPLQLQPSVSYWLYYNMGGRPIQYYDKTGSPTISQTPDGFHRGRLFVSLNSKLNNTIRVGIYYLIQNEFNLFTQEQRNMNIINQSTGKIERPFKNYNAIGLSLKFVFGKD
ncbi:MAG: DUF2490 domain-containing protein [Sphingobacteriales bacterium]|nr:MAG: DUF2490 domain-containing protein [Sphingobacteriales bacterium]